MNEEFNELYDMLSMDRDDVKKIKSEYENDMSVLLGRIRSYHINNVDISNEYDLENNFEKFRVEDIFIKYNLNNDAIEFKIGLLQNYLQDLFTEKKFNLYRRKKEEELSKNEYLEYINNPNVKSDRIAAWYKEFMNN